MSSGRQRRIVVVAFLLLGTLLLAISLRIEPGSAWFYPAALALAATWAIGAVVTGPVRSGAVRHPTGPVVLGLLLAGVFVAGALVIRALPWLDDQVGSVLEVATRGSGPLVVVVALLTGAAEELFFRGALYDTAHELRVDPVVATTTVYTVVTLATGNLALTAAAALLGLVVALQRRATGGVLASVLTHLTWSAAMLVALPRLF